MKKMDEWWCGGVIYQIYPRSFQDTNGDGVGDLKGIAQRLPYVASLGVDAIWISPFFKSPMKDFGYDVSDYRAVDPVFGTIDDFKVILDKAHDLGLKVMIDQVWSHTSDQHDWFKESRASRDNPKHDWYVWSDPKPDGTAPNNWLSYFGGPAWTWDARREQYYLHHFLSSQPALNFWNDDVKKAVKDVAAYWLDMGVDGFRLDVAHTYVHDKARRDNPARSANDPWATDVPRSSPFARQKRIYSMNVPENMPWIEELAAYINQWEGRCILGEAGGDDSEREAAILTQTGKRFQQAYSFGLIGTNMEKTDIVRTVKRIEEVVEDGWMCNAVSNHDFKRVASRIKGDASLADKAMFASVLGLSLRGSYCMYQGEELGLPQAELDFEDLVDPYDIMLYPNHAGRDGCRTPMPWQKDVPQAGFSTAKKTWLPVSPDHVSLAVDQQESDDCSILAGMRSFLAWRKKHSALLVGDLTLIEANDPVFAFRRSGQGGDVVAVFNCSDSEVKVSVPIVDGIKPDFSMWRNAGLSGDSLHLKPYGFAFFTKG
jgi:alpha-glucosidase